MRLPCFASFFPRISRVAAPGEKSSVHKSDPTWILNQKLHTTTVRQAKINGAWKGHLPFPGHAKSETTKTDAQRCSQKWSVSENHSRNYFVRSNIRGCPKRVGGMASSTHLVGTHGSFPAFTTPIYTLPHSAYSAPPPASHRHLFFFLYLVRTYPGTSCSHCPVWRPAAAPLYMYFPSRRSLLSN